MQQVAKEFDFVKKREFAAGWEDGFTKCMYGDPVPQNGESITILIPTYLSAGTLKRALDSALNQEGNRSPYKIIVIDADSTFPSETTRLMEEYRSCPEVSYFKNRDPGETWNKGIYQAKTKWVCMLHDDDVLFPHAVLCAEEAISKFGCKNLGGIVNSYNYILNNTKNLLREPTWGKRILRKMMHHAVARRCWQPKLRDFYWLNGNQYTATTCGALLLKEAVTYVGGFDTKYSSSDMFLLLKLKMCDRHYRVYRCGMPWGEYSFSSKNTVNKPYLKAKLPNEFEMLRCYIAQSYPMVRFATWLFKDAPAQLMKEYLVRFYNQFGGVDVGSELKEKEPPAGNWRKAVFSICQKVCLAGYYAGIGLWGEPLGPKDIAKKQR